MTFAYIARHGETDWNREGRYQGRLESTLTELGERQAEALASALAESDARRVISSPMQRTIATARPLARRLGIPIETDDRLIEIAHGTWEGRLRKEIERDDPDRMRRWRTNPESVTFQGGESLANLLERWQAFAATLMPEPTVTQKPVIRHPKITQQAIAESEEAIVLVTHDAIVRVAILDMLGRPLSDFWQPRVVNGGYVRSRFEAGKLRLLDECCDAHLAGIIADTSTQAL